MFICVPAVVFFRITHHYLLRYRCVMFICVPAVVFSGFVHGISEIK